MRNYWQVFVVIGVVLILAKVLINSLIAIGVILIAIGCLSYLFGEKLPKVKVIDKK
jgi:multisubunit Na+/H+ antiporter MnhC subunit